MFYETNLLIKKFRQLTMSHEGSYYLTGKKYLFSVNILNYDNDGMKRHNTAGDERDIVNTFKTIGFEIKFRKNGHVTINEVKNALSRFVVDMKPHENVRLLAFIFMGHGSEDDW